MNIIARTFQSISQRGLIRTFQSFLSIIEDLFFDLKYKVDTAEIVEVENLDITDEEKKHQERYQPTRIRHFKYLMKKLNLPKGSVFNDLGCGKGRILLIASNYNFKRVIGVEISKQLCEIAESNVALYEKKIKKRLPIKVVESDVMKYEVQDDENVFYLFRPFDNFIMHKVIENISASLEKAPRKVWLIINTDIATLYDDLFRTEKTFQQVAELVYGGIVFFVYVNR